MGGLMSGAGSALASGRGANRGMAAAMSGEANAAGRATARAGEWQIWQALQLPQSACALPVSCPP